MEPEVRHGAAEFTREFKLEAVRLIEDRGVSYRVFEAPAIRYFLNYAATRLPRFDRLTEAQADRIDDKCAYATETIYILPTNDGHYG